MAYTALYRKFRPLTFSQMVGQEHITDTLKKQIIADRVGHAYLFNGGRGTGKTSSAKILARAVNCLNLKDGEPCNECEICKSILDGSLTDVVEMDAASNNSVDDVRAIREEVNFLPTRAKYRVYIIDEVHMLSQGAFNALLKTLEEPPKHVKFILATTEPQKLPATILSRCQRFDFKRISNEDIIKRLKVICKESNIEITDNALNIIAILSEGAMRDAISILERCTGEDKGKISEDDVRDLVGIPKLTQIHEIVKDILEYNIENAITVVNQAVDEGKDIDNFLWEIIKYIKDLLIYKSTGSIEIYNEEEIKQIKIVTANISKERLLKLIYDLSKLANEIKWSTQKTIMFQAGIINACIDETKTVEENCKVEKQVENIKADVNKPVQISNTQKLNTKPVINNNTENKNTQLSKNKATYWDNVLNTLKENRKMGTYIHLIGSTAKELNDLVIEITLANKNPIAMQVLESHENKAEIEKLVSKEFGKPMNIRYTDNIEKKQNDTVENMANGLDIPINIIDE